jgi:hypothetical protein
METLEDVLSKVKADPSALFRQRSYREVCNWPRETVSYFKKAGYQLVLNRAPSWLEFANTARGLQTKQSGWKFHISLALADLPALYETMFDPIVRLGLTCKFADEQTANLHSAKLPPATVGYNSGKMAVLYCDDRHPELFLLVASAIEQDMKRRGIPPGLPVPPQSDQPLPGSAGYFFYRNERDQNGGYSRDGGYNRFNKPDPFRDGYANPTFQAYKALCTQRPEVMRWETARAYGAT